jgi:hypothetical protein
VERKSGGLGGVVVGGVLDHTSGRKLQAQNFTAPAGMSASSVHAIPQHYHIHYFQRRHYGTPIFRGQWFTRSDTIGPLSLNQVPASLFWTRLAGASVLICGYCT